MSGIMGGMGIIGSLIFLFLIVVIPISIYSAQKWAYKCYRELKKSNEMLAMLVADRGIKKEEKLPPSAGIDIVDR